MLTITNKRDCTGCYACINACPRECIFMESDREGFHYPEVEYNKCIKCGICISVCPFVNKKYIHNKPKAFACINNNESVRVNSSSGGLFTLIAEQIIKEGGVVFGAGFDENFKVLHSYVDKSEDLEKFRGAKYVQSKIGETFKQVREFLLCGRKVLFTGTPCQIEGLQSFLREESSNLICADIICHGVPSPKILEKYISYREKQIGSSIKSISFRLKQNGWKRYKVAFSFENGEEYQETADKDLFMKTFLSDICLRPSCYVCHNKTLNRKSDITLADFWGIENILPEMDDDKGTSLIFINSKNGAEIFEKVKQKTLYKEVDIFQAVKYNQSAIKASRPNTKRECFFNELNKLSFEHLVRKYCKDSIKLAIKNKICAITNRIIS